MKCSLIYHQDTCGDGYRRINKRVLPHDREVLTPASSGVLAAHDFVEHIGGAPAATLEDEIAAFGAIVVGRLEYSLLDYGRLCSPDRGVADEMANFIKDYGGFYGGDHLVGDKATLAAFDFPIAKRRRIFHERLGHGEWVAETVAEQLEQPKLAPRIMAWMELGIKHLERRFGDIDDAVQVFQGVRDAFDDLVRIDAQVMQIKIDGTAVEGWSLPPHRWEDMV